MSRTVGYGVWPPSMDLAAFILREDFLMDARRAGFSTTPVRHASDIRSGRALASSCNKSICEQITLSELWCVYLSELSDNRKEDKVSYHTVW